MRGGRLPAGLALAAHPKPKYCRCAGHLPPLQPLMIVGLDAHLLVANGHQEAVDAMVGAANQQLRKHHRPLQGIRWEGTIMGVGKVVGLPAQKTRAATALILLRQPSQAMANPAIPALLTCACTAELVIQYLHTLSALPASQTTTISSAQKAARRPRQHELCAPESGWPACGPVCIPASTTRALAGVSRQHNSLLPEGGGGVNDPLIGGLVKGGSRLHLHCIVACRRWLVVGWVICKKVGWAHA